MQARVLQQLESACCRRSPPASWTAVCRSLSRVTVSRMKTHSALPPTKRRHYTIDSVIDRFRYSTHGAHGVSATLENGSIMPAPCPQSLALLLPPGLLSSSSCATFACSRRISSSSVLDRSFSCAGVSSAGTLAPPPAPDGRRQAAGRVYSGRISLLAPNIVGVACRLRERPCYYVCPEPVLVNTRVLVSIDT